MTRRIILPIEGATEIECGGCSKRKSTRLGSHMCTQFGEPVARDLRVTGSAPKRLPACIQAEASHAALVRDARLGAKVRAAADEKVWTGTEYAVDVSAVLQAIREEPTDGNP